MKFFNLDLHIAVIADIKRIFEDLGHQVDDWTLSGHSWAMGRSPDKVDVVSATNWHSLDKNMCDAFYERYKDELSQYDGFICTYAPSFCLLYEKFKKPIITVAPIRYEAPFWDDKEKWEWLNEYLKDGIDNGLIIPIVNNKFDKKYCEIYTEREWKHIPSLCEYTEAPYNPQGDIFIYSSLFPMEMWGYDNLIKTRQQALPPKYDWKDLSKFKGIIHIPYCPSTMSIFENYTSSIPLFFPSYDFMLKLRKSFGRHGVLNQLSWREVNHLSAGSIIEYNTENNTIGDINNYGDIQSERDWIRLADFYDDEWMPHIQYFNNFYELRDLIRKAEVTQISQKMSDFNKVRKNKVYDSWRDTLENIL